MADEVTLVDATNDTTFPPVEIDGELNPGNNTEFHVDSVSSQLDKVTISRVFFIFSIFIYLFYK